jgi:hypothetical protein
MASNGLSATATTVVGAACPRESGPIKSNCDAQRPGVSMMRQRGTAADSAFGNSGRYPAPAREGVHLSAHFRRRRIDSGDAVDARRSRSGGARFANDWASVRNDCAAQIA